MVSTILQSSLLKHIMFLPCLQTAFCCDKKGKLHFWQNKTYNCVTWNYLYLLGAIHEYMKKKTFQKNINILSVWCYTIYPGLFDSIIKS